MTKLVYSIFLLSGAAALIFETVWFHLAGLIFGNSVWSATLILSGFMGGIALGNYLAARFTDRVKHPLRFYATLESVIALTGVSLVLLFPLFEQWLIPVFRPFLDTSSILSLLRLGIAFFIIIIPTTAMGATLPVLVKVLYRCNNNFGLVLGRLYGWNTLGAVIGALAGEIALIQWLGIRGTGLTAGLLNLIAACIAFRIGDAAGMQSLSHDVKEERISLTPEQCSWKGKRFLLAAFFCGSIMLALEVIWFRFMMLFFNGTTLVFAIMLAVVLAGIGAGGLIASVWYAFQSQAHVFLRFLVLLNGILVVATYRGLDTAFTILRGIGITSTPVFLVSISLVLMLPVSIGSGILFTVLGRAVKDEIRSETRASGMVTLANTIGAMLGAFTAGFFLLPYVGMELSFFLLAAGYGVLSVIVPSAGNPPLKRRRGIQYATSAVFLIVMILFPFGMMEHTYFRTVDGIYKNAKRIAVKEGLNETVFYYLYEAFGEPLHYRLVTNSFSMSSTSTKSKRYMKLFAYLPLMFHPHAQDALLISYGVGSTAKALTDTKTLKKIDIVDTSKDILAMSSIVFSDPEENPLHDQRVTAHIEDGRFFLRITEDRYDLITGEPPPPKISGVVYLYTKEYFELIYDRLSDGGISSYWLPVYMLHERETKSIIKAFCTVFRDCSLWIGDGLNWILMGTRNAVAHKSEAFLSRQWLDPAVENELKSLGFEEPSQVIATFIADARDLEIITGDTLPLTDNFPFRLSSDLRHSGNYSPLYSAMMDGENMLDRFQRSELIRNTMPEIVVEQSKPHFRYQNMMRNVTAPPAYMKSGLNQWEDLYSVLTRTSMQTLPLFLMGNDPQIINIAKKLIAEGRYTPAFEYVLAVHSIAERNYREAIVHLETFLGAETEMDPVKIYPIYIFALCMADEREKAMDAGKNALLLLGDNARFADYWQWINATFRLGSI